MKKLMIISSVIVGINTVVYAGGDILPTVFETEEVIVPLEPYVETYVAPVATPIVVPKAVVVPVPVVVPVVNNILPLGLYVAAGLTAARYDPNCNCPVKGDVHKTAGVIGRIGYDFNKFFGLEARGLKTNWKPEGGD